MVIGSTCDNHDAHMNPITSQYERQPLAQYDKMSINDGRNMCSGDQTRTLHRRFSIYDAFARENF